LYSYTILAALLVLSFGFTSAFAETFVSPDEISFNYVDSRLLPPSGPVIIDPMTGEQPSFDNSKQYILYPQSMESLLGPEKQLVSIDGNSFYLVPDPLDTTANMFAVLLLAIPFGLLVYRMSDNDPIPIKYAKLSGIAVAFSMLSMFTMPISIGNSFWGYAQATSNQETNSMPIPVDSFYFDNPDNFYSNGATTLLDENKSAIFFDGTNDYLVLDSNLPNKLNEFSISAWVNPDYKRGAPATLSITSHAEAFSLSINNDKVDENFAFFSIYDGIKWHTVQSKSAIPEQWTHISATYADQQIKIFVNGAQEGSVKIDGDYSLTHQYGESNQNSYDYLSLKSDLLVGSFNPNARDNASLSNHFSGLIDDITIYDKKLSSENIFTLDESNRAPDTIPESETQSAESKPEQTGTANEYGFVTNDDNPNDQKIEEVAAEGYKVKKPEENKKKDKTNQASQKVKDTLKENQSTEDKTPQDTTNNAEPQPNQPEVPPFDGGQISTSSNSTTTETLPTAPQKTAPLSEEYIADSDSLIRKLVRVSSDTDATFSDLPPINSKTQYKWKLYGDLNGTLVDLTNDPNVDLQLLDLNSDNSLDRAEWSTTDGITEYYLVAKIILATDGLHLDSDREFVDDIFYEIRAQDGIWTYPIPEGDYVRVTFEKDLTKYNDITVYAKSSGSATIEVYEKDGTEVLATFETIDSVSSPATFKVYLTNLVGEQSTFDLRIVGAAIEFDFISDPAAQIEQCKNGGVGDDPERCFEGKGNDANWITGNVNGEKAHWQEGDFLPYRAHITGLEIDATDFPTGDRIEVISRFAFDTAKTNEQKHAIDYIGSYNFTETVFDSTDKNFNHIDICSDLITNCNENKSDSSLPITVHPQLTYDYNMTGCAPGDFMGTPMEGEVHGWIELGGATSFEIIQFEYSPVIPGDPDFIVDTTATDCPVEFSIHYVIDGPTPDTEVLLAWGGHVSRNDEGPGGYWGSPNAIPNGSPYHMRVGDMTIKVNATDELLGIIQKELGNQELQLSATAIVRESQIILKKITEPQDTGAVFVFNTTGNGYTGQIFLEDGGENVTKVQTNANKKQNGDVTLAMGTELFSIAELVPSGWSLNQTSCVGTSFDLRNDTSPWYQGEPDPTGFFVDEGEVVTCTFENILSNATLIVHKDSGMFNDTFSFDLTPLDGQLETPTVPDLTTTDTDGNPDNMNFTAWTEEIEILAGNWTISETLPAGGNWKINPLYPPFCEITDGENIGLEFINTTANSVDFEVPPSAIIECYFTNDASSFLNITKISGMFPGELNITTTTEDGMAYNGSLNELIKIQSGNWTLYETLPANWKVETKAKYSTLTVRTTTTLSTSK
jgi:hypothetical protein